MHSVTCPTCGRAVDWSPESRWRPFCSDRCRLIDLGDWMSERRAIPDDEAASADNTGPSDTDRPHDLRH